MKTIKVSEASGAALDWMVAKCEGIDVVAWHAEDRATYFVVLAEAFEDKKPTTFYGDPDDTFYPSVNWAQGGPIIDRERITLLSLDADWEAQLNGPPYPSTQIDGPTPLIAAMRCYVASKLGDTVEVPEELV